MTTDNQQVGQQQGQQGQQPGAGGTGGTENPSNPSNPSNTQVDPAAQAKADLDAANDIIAKLRSDNLTLTQANRELLLRTVPDSERPRIEGILRQVDQATTKQAESDEVQNLSKDLYARELVLEYKEQGITLDKAELLKLGTPEEMRVHALQKQIEHLRGGSGGSSGGGNGGAPDPSKISSDRGGGSGVTASSGVPQIEGTGDTAVVKHLMGLISAKRGG